MEKLCVRRVMLVVSILAVGGFLFGQGPRPPLDRSTQEALIAEVRALRAEINHVTSAGIRTQLLIARLQIQEQRVLTVARQLADAQSALATVQSKINGERTRVRQLEDTESRATALGRPALQQAIFEAGAQIEQQQRQEQQLQTREIELRRAVDDAQARWVDFNDRLDALERSLPSH